MKTAKFLLLICLTLYVKIGFSQSVDSMLVKFISNFELKVIYDTQYVNPPNKAIWSKIHNQYINFYELPSYYGEAYKEGKCMSSNQFAPFKFKSKGVIMVKNNFILS